MKSFDINEIDKTHFKCYKFEDNSVYYGEISFLDELHNLVTDWEKHSAESLKNLKLVRHGIGIALYDVTEENTFSSRYEGHWSKDKKTGQGISYYPDKSFYEGNFINNLYEGFGKFFWPNQDCYIGEWKNGKMEGEGEFRHADGHILKGKFANNYHLDKERFINPFLPYDDMEIFKTKNSEYLLKIKQENQKFSRANIMRITNQQELLSVIEQTILNNKTPLILRSSSFMLKKSELFNMLNRDFKELDLRYFSLKTRENLNNQNNVFSEIKKIVQVAINKGLYMILNFDDCSIKYDDSFDPDIKEFYGNSMLSSFMWTPHLFSQHKCWQNHLSMKSDMKYDKHFKFIVYSKFIIDSNLQEHDLINVIEKRFEKSFPLKNMNILIMSK